MQNYGHALRATLLCAILSSFAFTQSACTKKEDSGQLRLVMPGASAVSTKTSAGVTAQSATIGTSSSDWNTGINPTVGSDINCYAVFVGGGDLKTNFCNVGATESVATPITFGPNFGFVPSGQAVTIEDVPVGPRVVYLLGLRATSAQACVNYKKSLDKSNLSHPYLIAVQPVNVGVGDVPVHISPLLDATKKIHECEIAGAVDSGGGNSATTFGDKRDGTFTPSAAASPLASGVVITSVGTRTGSTLSSSKTFNAHVRMTGIAGDGPNAGKQITTGATFGAADFEAGDEVAWYVAGGASSFGPPDDQTTGACGGNFFLGRYGTARIASIPNSTQMIFTERITDAASRVRVANLNASPNSTDFCTIVISRVASFEKIHVPTNTSFMIKSRPFSYNEGTGGFLMIRAEDIVVEANATLNVYGDGYGFMGGANGSSPLQGDGVHAAGSTNSYANYNGGAPANSMSRGGSGGGNGGSGGLGANGSAAVTGGSSVTHCGGGICLPLSSQKAYMGGGGGGGTSMTGGAGGGVVIVYARRISGAGNFVISSNGISGNPSGNGPGGGAGGTIALFNRSSTIAAMQISTFGGNGGSGTNGGGGGGGGVSELVRCSTASTTQVTTTVQSGSGAGFGTPGGLGFSYVKPDDSICAAAP